MEGNCLPFTSKPSHQ